MPNTFLAHTRLLYQVNTFPNTYSVPISTFHVPPFTLFLPTTSPPRTRTELQTPTIKLPKIDHGTSQGRPHRVHRFHPRSKAHRYSYDRDVCGVQDQALPYGHAGAYYRQKRPGQALQPSDPSQPRDCNHYLEEACATDGSEVPATYGGAKRLDG